MAFERTLTVRFDDVDWARVVYYPRLFGYTHQVFEDFFAAEVGVPYSTMLSARGLGFPTVHTEADFRAPLRFGDSCRVELSVLRVGERSVTCRYRLFLGARLCAELRVVTVCTAMDTFQSLPMPPEVRVAFERHLVPDAVAG